MVNGRQGKLNLTNYIKALLPSAFPGGRKMKPLMFVPKRYALSRKWTAVFLFALEKLLMLFVYHFGTSRARVVLPDHTGA